MKLTRLSAIVTSVVVAGSRNCVPRVNDLDGTEVAGVTSDASMEIVELLPVDSLVVAIGVLVEATSPAVVEVMPARLVGKVS